MNAIVFSIDTQNKTKQKNIFLANIIFHTGHGNLRSHHITVQPSGWCWNYFVTDLKRIHIFHEIPVPYCRSETRTTTRWRCWRRRTPTSNCRSRSRTLATRHSSRLSRANLQVGHSHYTVVVDRTFMNFIDKPFVGPFEMTFGLKKGRKLWNIITQHH